MSNFDYEYYSEMMSNNLKNKLVGERIEEIRRLKKRIKELIFELDGMGIPKTEIDKIE